MSTDQMKFLNALRGLFDDTHAEMVKMADKREELRRMVADGVYTNEYASGETEEIERKIEGMRSKCEETARGMIAQRLEELESADTLRPEEINADCELLKLDLLTQKDIEQIATRNANNPTMCRLIDRYATSHGLTVPMPDYIVELASDRNETEAMREVVRVGVKWVGDPKRGQSVLDRLFEQVGL